MNALSKAALFIPLFFAITALCVCLQRRRARRHGEWNYLTPGPFYWFGLCSGLIVSMVATLVVASGRAGGLEGVLFALFFIAITVFLALQGIVQQTRWSSQMIVTRTMFLQTRTMSWNELARAGVDWSGQHWIAPFEGQPLRFSPYDNGYEQLLDKIACHLPRNGPPAEPVISPPATLQFAGATARSNRQAGR